MEQTETLLQRIEAPRLPRLEQTGQRHARLAALVAAGSPLILRATTRAAFSFQHHQQKAQPGKNEVWHEPGPDAV